METKRYHIIIHGRVQGVFFRYNAMKLANRLGITGYVRNLHDGTVEVIAEGGEPQLKELLQFCKQGPLLAKVKKVVVMEEKPKGEFEDFRVKY
jgi:acylphosphatase